MNKLTRAKSLYEMTMAGLEDSIAYSRGEKMSLVTIRVFASQDTSMSQANSGAKTRRRTKNAENEKDGRD